MTKAGLPSPAFPAGRPSSWSGPPNRARATPRGPWRPRRSSSDQAAWEAPAAMPYAERRSDRSLARAESRAREARQRGLREGNAGRPAVGARYIRAGLRQLGWREDGEQPDWRQIHEAHHALAARLLGILAEWESMQGRTEYGLRLLDRAEKLAAADDRGIL